LTTLEWDTKQVILVFDHAETLSKWVSCTSWVIKVVSVRIISLKYLTKAYENIM